MNRGRRSRGHGINHIQGHGGMREMPMYSRPTPPTRSVPQYAPYSDYEDDLGPAGKRPIDDRDLMGVKRQRTSSMQMMNLMIQDSQRELANLTFNNTPRSGGEHLNQVLNRQQMLLEMQSEMIAGMSGKSEGATAGRRSERDYDDDPYVDVPPYASSRMPSSKRGMRSQSFGERPYPGRYDEPSSRSRGQLFAPSRSGMTRTADRGGANRIANTGRGRASGSRGRGKSHSRDSYEAGNEALLFKDYHSPYDYNPYLDYEYDDGFNHEGPAIEYYVSIEGKLNNYIKCLLEYDDLFTAVQAIETTRHDNSDFVKIRTDYKAIEDMDKDPYIDGNLRINGVVVARKEGYTKHQVKEDVYSQALYHLLTKSVSELFAISNKLYGELPAEAKKDHRGGKQKRDHRFIISRLKTLIECLQESVPVNYGRGAQENLVHEIDVACGEADAGVTLVVKKMQNDSFICELYVDDMMLATGEEGGKKGAIKNAYRNTKRFLTRCNYQIEKVVRESRRLQDVNCLDPTIIDVIYKGKNHERGSNLNTLKVVYPDTYATNVKTKRDAVVYETGDDVTSMPYKALEETACANCMLLEYVLYSGPSGAPTRCLIYLQGDLIADTKGFNKYKAKLNSATKGLHFLRQYFSLIHIKSLDFESAMKFEKTKDLATALKEEQPDLKMDWEACTNKNGATADDKQKPDVEPDELSPWVDRVLENLVSELSETEGFGELLFDHDLPKFHMFRLKDLAQKYPIHVVFKRKEIKQEGGKDEKTSRGNYAVVQKIFLKNAEPTEVVNRLKNLNNKSGRYKLVHYKDENDLIVKC